MIKPMLLCATLFISTLLNFVHASDWQDTTSHKIHFIEMDDKI